MANDDLVPATDPEKRFAEIARNLSEGQPSPTVRVRELLRWFGAHRRGFNVIERIRTALEGAKIRTTPDFEEVYIDSDVEFALFESEDNGENSGAEEQPKRKRLSDPVWKISRLKSANKPVVAVARTESLEKAISKMMLGDFSQLPVVNGRSIDGAITWNSIGTGLAFGPPGRSVQDFTVQDFIVDVKPVSGTTPLLKAIPEIIQSQFVVVVAKDKTITGIVTATDLSEEFQEQAEPFLALREIEHQIRRLIIDIGRTSDEELRTNSRSFSEATSDDDISIHGMNFGDYVAIMEKDEWWPRLKIPIDKKEFIGKLDVVRKIRNRFMHFDPDTFDRDGSSDGDNSDLVVLRRMNAFLQRLLDLLSTSSLGDERASK